MFSYIEYIHFNLLKIPLLALSISEFSSDVRYILVVRSEVCPIPALMTETGTLQSRAIVAQLCRAAWNDSPCCNPNIVDNRFNRRL